LGVISIALLRKSFVERLVKKRLIASLSTFRGAAERTESHRIVPGIRSDVSLY
jgi:hypothetical protein